MPTIDIFQELRQVEELWDEFFDIICVFNLALPRGCYGVELAVSHVKPETHHSLLTPHSITNLYQLGLAVSTGTISNKEHKTTSLKA